MRSGLRRRTLRSPGSAAGSRSSTRPARASRTCSACGSSGGAEPRCRILRERPHDTLEHPRRRSPRSRFARSRPGRHVSRVRRIPAGHAATPLQSCTGTSNQGGPASRSIQCTGRLGADREFPSASCAAGALASMVSVHVGYVEHDQNGFPGLRTAPRDLEHHGAVPSGALRRGGEAPRRAHPNRVRMDQEPAGSNSPAFRGHPDTRNGPGSCPPAFGPFRARRSSIGAPHLGQSGTSGSTSVMGYL